MSIKVSEKTIEAELRNLVSEMKGRQQAQRQNLRSIFSIERWSDISIIDLIVYVQATA